MKMIAEKIIRCVFMVLTAVITWLFVLSSSRMESKAYGDGCGTLCGSLGQTCYNHGGSCVTCVETKCIYGDGWCCVGS